MNNFTKHSVIYSISKIVRLLISIAVSVVIARLLGPEGKGQYTIALLIPSLSFIFMGMGLGESIVYFIGKKEISEKSVLGTVSLLYLLISSVTFVALYFLLGAYGARLLPGLTPMMMKVALFMVFPYIFISTFDHFFLAKNKVYLYGLVDVLNGLLLLMLLITLYFKSIPVDAGLVLLGELIITGLLCLYSASAILKIIGWPDFKNVYKNSKTLVSYGAKVNVTNILSFVHVRADSFMINYLLNPFSVGIYSVAVNITEQIWLIPRSISKILFKEVSLGGEETDKLTLVVLKATIFLSFLMAVFIAIVGLPLIRILYSADFVGAYLPMCILLVGVVASAGSRIITSAFHGSGDTNSAIKASVASVPLNIGLNLFMIPWLGIVGAAITTMISYSVIFIYRVYLYRKLKDLSYRDFLITNKDMRLYFSVTRKIALSSFNKIRRVK